MIQQALCLKYTDTFALPFSLERYWVFSFCFIFLSQSRGVIKSGHLLMQLWEKLEVFCSANPQHCSEVQDEIVI